MPTCARPLAVVAVISLCAAAHAQWSSDPQENLIVEEALSDQNQAKLAIGQGASAGSVWVSWLDGIGSGWDVRVQRVSEGGVLAYPPGGVLVADRDFSSTQDYGLDVDADGNAWLAFRLDSATSQIAVQKVAPDGSLLLNGGAPLVVGTGPDSRNQPDIVVTSDGHAVVSWQNNNDVRLVKISGTDGSPLWTHTEVAGTSLRNSPNDLQPGDDGSVILSYQHGGTQFFNPKHLWATKLTSAGAPAWASPVIVYDLSGLASGNFPKFLPDGAGGAVFGWHGGNNNGYIQHILADGSERFPHNGVTVSTHVDSLQVSTTVLFDAASDDMYLFWLERNQGQTQWGVYGQKIDGATGARQWGEEGRAIVPLDGTERSFVTPVFTPGGGAIVAWFEGGFGSKNIHAARVDADGNTLWGPITVSSNPSDKGRLTAAITPGGMAITAWSDQRSDGGDIYAQNVNSDGTLGAAPAGCLCETDGNEAQVDVFDLLAYLDLWFAHDAAANLDAVPEVDVFDLLAFLDCWFPASAGLPCS